MNARSSRVPRLWFIKLPCARVNCSLHTRARLSPYYSSGGGGGGGNNCPAGRDGVRSGKREIVCIRIYTSLL